MQWAAQRTRRQFAIGRGGFLQRTPGLDFHSGVQHGVNRRDAFQMCGNQFAGRNLAFADQARLLPRGKRQDVGQVPFSRIAGITQ